MVFLFFLLSNVLLSRTICSYCSYFMSKLTDRPSFFLFIHIHIYPSQNLNPWPKSSGVNISTVGALLFMNNLPKSFFSEQFHGCCVSRLLVGAPLQTTGTKQTGDVFRCPLDRGNSTNCSRLQLGESRLGVPFFKIKNPGEEMTTSRTTSCTTS